MDSTYQYSCTRDDASLARGSILFIHHIFVPKFLSCFYSVWWRWSVLLVNEHLSKSAWRTFPWNVWSTRSPVWIQITLWLDVNITFSPVLWCTVLSHHWMFIASISSSTKGLRYTTQSLSRITDAVAVSGETGVWHICTSALALSSTIY